MTSNFKKVIGSATLGLAMLIGVGSSITAQAQYPQYPQQYPNQNDRYRRDRDRDWNRGRDQDRSRRGKVIEVVDAVGISTQTGAVHSNFGRLP
jgi:hypothetical protein